MPRGPVVIVQQRTNRVTQRVDYPVSCKTGQCTWTYVASVKADAEQQARWHRDQHRREQAG